MDQPTILNKINTDLTPVAPDLIVDTELRGVLNEIVAMEGLVVNTVPNPLTFQSAAGTFYSAVITSPTVNIDPTGNVIGWKMLFLHNAASFSIAGSGVTFINPDAYIPSQQNVIEAQVIDNSTVIARVVVSPTDRLVKGTNKLQVSASNIEGWMNALRWVLVQHVVNGPTVTIGNIDVAGGTNLIIESISQAIRFVAGSNEMFRFDLATGELKVLKLADTESDGTPVKAAGFTANGTFVKFPIPSGGGSFTNYLGEFATLAALATAHPTPDIGELALITETGEWAVCVVDDQWSSKYKGFYPDLTAVNNDHPTPQVGDRAFLTNTLEWAVCITAGTWEPTTLDAYDVATATLDELEDESNWSHQNIYIGNGLLAPDLVAGKRAIHRTEPGVQYECLPGSPNYWIRTGNRVPATLKYSLGATGVDATADTSVAKDTDYLESAFIPLSATGNAGAVLPGGGGAVIDVHAGGTTVFSSTKVEIADATATGTQSITPVELAAGTKVEVFIDSVPSTPGQGYKVAIKGFWKF